MNKSTILATVLAAFLCITASSTYLSSNAVAQSTGITETIDFKQASKKSTLANFKSNLYYSDKFKDVSVPVLNEYYLGQLIYFFEKACGISGYLLEINPFNQPGVEAYKKNMFALLNKPGYEEASKAIRERLKK